MENKKRVLIIMPYLGNGHPLVERKDWTEKERRDYKELKSLLLKDAEEYFNEELEPYYDESEMLLCPNMTRVGLTRYISSLIIDMASFDRIYIVRGAYGLDNFAKTIYHLLEFQRLEKTCCDPIVYAYRPFKNLVNYIIDKSYISDGNVPTTHVSNIVYIPHMVGISKRKGE